MVVPLPRGRRGYLDFAMIQGGTADAHGQWKIYPSRKCMGFVYVMCSLKTRAGRLVKAMAGAKWVGSEGCYRMLPSAAEEFQRLYGLGWDVSQFTGELIPPRR